MTVDEDVLEEIRHLPDQVNDISVSTELKFITIGALLARCAQEIITLREENARLRTGGRAPKKKMRGV